MPWNKKKNLRSRQNNLIANENHFCSVEWINIKMMFQQMGVSTTWNFSRQPTVYHCCCFFIVTHGRNLCSTPQPTIILCCQRFLQFDSVGAQVFQSHDPTRCIHSVNNTLSDSAVSVECVSSTTGNGFQGVCQLQQYYQISLLLPPTVFIAVQSTDILREVLPFTLQARCCGTKKQQ